MLLIKVLENLQATAWSLFFLAIEVDKVVLDWHSNCASDSVPNKVDDG